MLIVSIDLLLLYKQQYNVEGFFYMDGTTVNIGESLGSETWIIELLLGTGPWGVVGVLLLYIIKKLILPEFTKWVESRDNQFHTLIGKMDNMVDSQKELTSFLGHNLKEFKEDIKISHSSHDRIVALVTELISDGGGSLDEQRSINTFAIYVDKCHLHAKAFYDTRCRTNGIQENYEGIGRKYMDKSSQLASKMITQLQQYSYQGIPLSHYFTDRGASSYFRHIFNELFLIQQERAHKEETNQKFSITDEDIENGLHRNLSKLMGGFKIWLNAHENNYMVQCKQMDLKIIHDYKDDDGEVEVL